MGRRPKPKITFDRDLADLPEPMRRREFMMRVEAVIFASSRPVTREILAALVAPHCHLEQLIDDIRDELRTRPYQLVEVAGGFQYRTRPPLAEVILASRVIAPPPIALSPVEQLVLTAIAYFQPVTRMQVADVLGKPVSRDAIAALRSFGLIATGPRSPQPGAPYTYVTTPAFLELSGLASLRDLPDLDRLEDAGLLGRAPLPNELRSALGIIDDADVDAAADTEMDLEEFSSALSEDE
jgi:segregation and condensation protein B